MKTRTNLRPASATSDICYLRHLLRSTVFLILAFLLSYPINSIAQEEVNFSKQEDPGELCELYGDDPCTVTLNNIASSQLGVVGYSNEVVCITGVFTVDTPDFTFDGCTIQMSPGASIQVEQGKDFYLLYSNVFSCEEMWKEIRGKVGSRLFVENCHIEDGQYAIHAIAVDELWCTDNFFNRNHVSIRIGVKSVTNPPPPTSTLFAIYGNDIRCTSNLFAPFSGQTPLPASTSFAGIWVSDYAGIGIGNPNEGINFFKTQMVGILVERTTNALIRNCAFDQMLFLTTNEGYSSNTGTGVLVLENSFVRQVGLGMGETDLVSFHNCEFAAIRALGSTIQTKLNRITGVHAGAIVTDSPGSNFSQIEFNRIEGTTFDLTPAFQLITIDRSSVDVDFIQHNIIDFESQAIGIHLHDMYASTGTAIISNNTVNMSNNNGYFGMDIHPNDGDSVWIHQNVLNLEGVSEGIIWFISQGVNHEVYDNDLTGTSAGRGIWFHMSQENYICLNEVSGFSSGFEFELNAMGSLVGLNKFTNLNNYGLRLLGNGINLGDQYWKGNTWSGTFGFQAAQHTGSDFTDSRFFVNDDLSCNPDYWPNSGGTSSVDPAVGWFFNDTGGCLNSCNLTFASKTYNSDSLSALEYSIIDGSYDASEQSAPAIWDNHRYLYKKILNTGMTNVSNDPILLDWVADQQNSLVGDFYEAGEMIREAFSAQNSDVAAILLLQDDIGELMDVLEVVHLDWMNAPSNEDLIFQYEELLGIAIEKKSQRDSLAIIAGNDTNSQLEDGLAFVSSFDCAELHEQYLQRVLEIRFLKLLGQELTDEMQNELEIIASQCYDLGGIAVSLAARLMEGAEMYDYIHPVECDEDFLFPTISTKPKTQLPVSVFPNPVSESINLEFNTEDPFYGKVQLLNTEGKTIETIRLNGTYEARFNLFEHPNGLFIVRIIPVFGSPTSIKVLKQ